MDVVIMSASRPKLVPFLINSFDEKIHYSKKFFKIWHEDYVYSDESKKVTQIVNRWADLIIEDCPPKRIGQAYKDVLNKIKSPLFFNLQDDWEFELPIDLDHISYVMNKNPHINCITFNKKTNIEYFNNKSQIKKIDGLTLMEYNHFPFLPGIWRKEFIEKYWIVSQDNNPQEGYFNDNLSDKSGIYFYGDENQPRTIRHLGWTWAVKSWGNRPRTKEGYGGNFEMEEAYKKYRAPWLPPEPKRPLYLIGEK